ncbi:MAG TPA: O-antigen ligase family protein, partial [Candidatus Saccharimonadales bacterium]|nr:O-antigen ligase family protein [Candidatus Saccharimonadales bacterium]
MSFQRYKRRLHRISDWITEWVIYLAILFGPWAFGTTQPWAIEVMNGVGFALGLLWLGKLFIRASGYHPLRWTQFSGKSESGRAIRPQDRFTWILGTGTFCILLYSLIGAWNARAIYHPAQWSFEYRNAVRWLPHSYDRAKSWAAFWKFLGLAGLFWALRDWLLTLSPREAAELKDKSFSIHGNSAHLPVRLCRLFWVLAINGTLLATQGLMQRVEGGDKLLWLVEPRINQTADSQFGPYAYRANAAQYFNLLWPAVLGFWWASVSSRRRRKTPIPPRHNHAGALLPCIVLMAICPLISTSRGGAIVLGINLMMAGGILWMAQWRSHWTAKALLFLLLAAIIGVGVLLGWKSLAPRMEMFHQGYESRAGLNVTGRYMAQDNPWFGTGAETYGTMFQLYRRAETDDWLAFLHNDWLETLISFGRIGFAAILGTLLLIFSRYFFPGGIPGNKYFVLL